MRSAPEGSASRMSAMLMCGCGSTTKTEWPCEIATSPVVWRICARISFCRTLVENSQGTAATVMAAKTTRESQNPEPAGDAFARRRRRGSGRDRRHIGHRLSAPSCFVRRLRRRAGGTALVIFYYVTNKAASRVGPATAEAFPGKEPSQPQEREERPTEPNITVQHGGQIRGAEGLLQKTPGRRGRAEYRPGQGRS